MTRITRLQFAPVTKGAAGQVAFDLRAPISLLALMACIGCSTATTSPISNLTGDSGAQDSVTGDGAGNDGAANDSVGPDDTAADAADATIDAKPEPYKAPLGPIFATDADRDGVVSFTSKLDATFRGVGTAEAGASFLANLDDDDDNGLEDAYDLKVNGAGDELDLARVRIAPWKEAPNGTTARLGLDSVSGPNVRVWRRLSEGTWKLALGASAECKDVPQCDSVDATGLTTADLRGGVELGVEGRRFRMSAGPKSWDGTVQLSLDVTDTSGAPVASAALPKGHDEVVLRVAPWMTFGNMDVFDHVDSASYYPTFVKGIKSALANTGIEYKPYTNWNDQWTQDMFNTGYTTIPGPDGVPHGMRAHHARPWGRQDGAQWLPIAFLRTRYLGPDTAIFSVYKKASSGSTYDSYGNHDLAPGSMLGDVKYPLGRIVHGTGTLPEYKAFYDAQAIQGPSLVVKTSWLAVGHIDETTSWVPSQTPRGWKLLMASDSLGKDLLEEQAKKGNGGVKFFIGLKNYDPKTDKLKDAVVSIDETLADVDLMQWSQEAEIETEGQRVTLVEAFKFADDEIVAIPLLTEEIGGKIAYLPGMVNALVFSNTIVMADPFGPVIDGGDLFKVYVNNELATPKHSIGLDGKGMTTVYVDDYASYHVALGEVHCGTNPEGAPALTPWWPLGR